MSKFATLHAPQRFDDLMFADPAVAQRLRQYAEGCRTKPVILHGAYGGGKSTIARLLVQARDPVNKGFWQTINCSNADAGFLKSIEGAWRFSELLAVEPMCVLEEVDLLPRKLQFALRAFMDDYGGMFIMTTNHPHLIDGSIRSRCDDIEIVPLIPKDYLAVAQSILSQYQVTVDQECLTQLLSECHNWRHVMGALEDIVQEHQFLSLKTVAK